MDNYRHYYVRVPTKNYLDFKKFLADKFMDSETITVDNGSTLFRLFMSEGESLLLKLIVPVGMLEIDWGTT